MQYEQEFNQRRRNESYGLSLGSEELVFKGNDGDSTWTVRQRYEHLPFETSTFRARNTWFRNVGFIWLGVGVFQLILWLSDTNSGVVPVLWPVLGAICIGLYFFLQRSYTFFDSDAGRLVVLQDDQHDAIVSELEQRRNSQILELYGRVFSENDPDRERSRFKFLLDRDVIDQVRYEEALREIDSLQTTDLIEAPDHTPPPGTVH